MRFVYDSDMFMKDFRETLKNCQGVFDAPLEILVRQSVDSIASLPNEEIVFLKRVLEKLKTKQVQAHLYKQALQKLELVEKRTGPRRVQLQGEEVGEQFLRILKTVKEMKAEMLHLKPDLKPHVRVGGALHELADVPVFSVGDLQSIIGEYISPAYSAVLSQYKVVDFSLSVPGLSRFRVSAYYEEGRPAISLKQIPFDIPELESLRLEPTILQAIEEGHGGLYLVSGPAVSGKSTLVAAILNHLNQTRPLRIQTFEDPIEFLYRDAVASITQREVGSDMQSIASGVRYVLKGGVNWLFVSSVDSLELLEFLITAAESSVNVILTVPGVSVTAALETLTSLIPREGNQSLLDRFSQCLRLCLCQHLYHNKEKSVVAVREYMIPDANLKNLIRECRWQGILPQLETLPTCRSLHKRAFELVQAQDLEFESLLEEIEDRDNFESRYRPQLKRKAEGDF